MVTLLFEYERDMNDISIAYYLPRFLLIVIV
jgi:hypothetical protein